MRDEGTPDKPDCRAGLPLERIMRIFTGKPGFLLARIDQISNVLYAARSGGETLAQAEMLIAIAAQSRAD